MILLDHNATTPVLPEVVEALLPWLRDEGAGNPSSAHALGRRAKAAVDTAREHVAALVGAHPDEVVFCSGGTEADHLAIQGTVAPGERVVTTSIEHPAVFGAVEAARADVVLVGPDASGVVPAERLLAAASPGTRLVSVMYAHNETGALQPVGAVGPALRDRGVLVHSDAAQAGGRVAVDLHRDGLDLVTLVGHKLGAPKGVGALVVRRGVALRPLLRGGGQEGGRRAGTENVPWIVAMGEACRLAKVRIARGSSDLEAVRDHLQLLLTEAIPGLRVSALQRGRLPNTLHVCVPGVSGREVLARAPEVAASTGSACHAGSDEASAVLVAMGVPRADARGALRLSLGFGTTRDEVERAAGSLIQAIGEVRGG